MRFIFVLVLTAILSYLAILILPWWIPMPIAFLIILWKPMNKWKSFLAAGLGAAICFILIASVKDFQNQQILSSKIAALFHLPSPMLLILIFGIIGFITAGLGAWTGVILRTVFNKSNSAKVKIYSGAGK